MNSTRALTFAVGVFLASASGAMGEVNMQWVSVGDVGNVPDTHGDGYGGVAYVYRIGVYEVTNSRYCEFLNAVASEDPHELWMPEMGAGWQDIGGIARSGVRGSYTYAVRPGRGSRPVNYVDWYDCLRFANWMHNGQPSGAQDPTTTEDGAYDMSLGSSVVRRPGALVWLPSEDEWYKAAYYKGGGTDAGYWDYPTQSDTAPTAEGPPGAASVGNGSANYYDGGYAVGAPWYTTEVGAYAAKPSDSPYGTFDQAGNVWEWTEAATSPTWRIIRGGSFNFYASDTHACARDSVPVGWGCALGFRVAAIPEPTSVFLLALGGAAIIRRRKP